MQGTPPVPAFGHTLASLTCTQHAPAPEGIELKIQPLVMHVMPGHGFWTPSRMLGPSGLGTAAEPVRSGFLLLLRETPPFPVPSGTHYGDLEKITLLVAEEPPSSVPRLWKGWG